VESETVAIGEPVPGRPDLEAALGVNIAKRALWVGPPLIGLFWILQGPRGGLSAAAGVAIIVVNFLISGLVMSRAARHSLAAYHAAALFGFFLRMGLITVAMLAAIRLADVDRVALGVTVVACYLALLFMEAAAETKSAGKEREWTS
jgi:hypothetical protein